MKKIMKFFPVALAAFALASCSDDLSFSDANKAKSPYAITVTGEDLGGDDITRSAIASYPSHSKAAFKTVWTTTDKLCTYDDNLSVWDRYVYQGTNYTSNGDWDLDGYTTAHLTSGFTLAAFPFGQVKGVSRDMEEYEWAHLQMTIPATMTYAENTPADGTPAYVGNLPMYGKTTAGSSNLGMNFLTAMVKVAVRDLPKGTKTIILKSEPTWTQTVGGTNFAASTEAQKKYQQTLTGQFDALIKKNVSTDAPVLAPLAELSETYGREILVTIDNTADGLDAQKDSASVWIPIVAQPYEKLTVGYSANADGSAATVFGTKEKWAPARKKVWEVQFTCARTIDNAEGWVPGEITDVIWQYKDAINTLLINASNAANKLTVTSGDNSRNNRIQMPQMANNAKVVIDLSNCGTDMQNSLTLEDRDAANRFTGSLTLIPGVYNGDKTIIVDLPNADVIVAGEGTTLGTDKALGNIRIQDAKTVTIAPIADNPVTCESFTIQEGSGYVAKGATVKTLTAENATILGVTHTPDLVQVNGGTVETLRLNNGTEVKMFDGKIYDIRGVATHPTSVGGKNEQVTIYSEGDSYIRDVNLWLNNTRITSKLTKTTCNNVSLDDALDKQTWDANVDGGVKSLRIYTAAQLYKAFFAEGAANVSGGYVIIADEIDMNHTKVTGATTSGDTFVWGYSRGADITNKALNITPKVTAPTGVVATDGWCNINKDHKNVIKNLEFTTTAGAGNGLIKSAGHNVKIFGLQFVSPKFAATTATNANGVGVLVGKQAAGTLDIENDTIVTASLENGGGAASSSIAMLVGEYNAATALNIKETVAGGTVKGHYFVGGLIGKVSAAATINIFDTQATPTFELVNTQTSLVPTKAGTFGNFIGGATAAADIKLYDCAYGTALTAAQKKALQFDNNINEAEEPFFGGNPWIGYCSTLKDNQFVTYKSDPNKKGIDFNVFTYKATSMEKQKTTGAANYAGGAVATQKYVYAGVGGEWNVGNTVYNDTKQYGWNIYIDAYYQETLPTKVAYNNTYED